MLTVVFDSEGPLIQGLKSCTETSNVNCYCQTLQKLHIIIKNNYLHNFNDVIILLHNDTHPQGAHTLKDQLMPGDGMCSNILHIAQTHHPETFTSFGHKSKFSKSVHSSQMVMCSRLWYSCLGKSPRNICQWDTKSCASVQLLSKCLWQFDLNLATSSLLSIHEWVLVVQPHIILPCLIETGTSSFKFSNNNHQDFNSSRPGIHLKLYTKLQFSQLLMFREIISNECENISNTVRASYE